MSEYVEAYADVNLLYGGLFVKDEGHWAEVVEVTDLDSATGTTDMVLVDQGSLSIETMVGHYGTTTRLGAERACLKSAMVSCGPGWHEHWRITGLSRQEARLTAYAALWSYGHRDIDASTVLATSKEYSAGGESWKVEGFVDGESGLRDWLADTYGLDVRESAS